MPPINRILNEDLDKFSETPDFDTYQRVAAKSAIYPGQGTILGLLYTVIKLNGEAGELAEHVGKSLRDDWVATIELELDGFSVVTRPMAFDRKDKLIKELGDVLWYVSAICNELDIHLEDVATANLQKLWDRTDRNVLQGSGDDR
jgi:NTP pyrophosphatase (non-canonical NTP hydrolase)